VFNGSRISRHNKKGGKREGRTTGKCPLEEGNYLTTTRSCKLIDVNGLCVERNTCLKLKNGTAKEEQEVLDA